MDTHVQHIFSFYTAKDLSPRNSVIIHSVYIFINIIKSILHRHAHRATSQVILKVIKLTMILTVAGPQDSPALLRTEVLASSRCSEVSSQVLAWALEHRGCAQCPLQEALCIAESLTVHSFPLGASQGTV